MLFMFLLVALQLGLFIAISLTCVALWNYIFAQVSAGREIVTYAPRCCVPWTGRDVGLTAVIWLGMQILCTLPFTLESKAPAHAADTQVAESDSEASALEKHPFGLMVAVSLGNIVAVGAACLWLRSRGADNHDLGFLPVRGGRDLQLGVSGFAAASMPVFLIQIVLVQYFEIPAKHAVSDIFQAQPGMLTLLATAFSAVVVAPLAEEFLFRVVLQGWLEAVYTQRAAMHLATSALQSTSVDINSPAADALLASISGEPASGDMAPDYAAAAQRAADDDPSPPALVAADPAANTPEGARSAWPIVLSSLVFALVHLGNGPSPVPLFFFALVLGYLYRQTHRLWPSVIAHASLNALSTLMLAAGAG